MPRGQTSGPMRHRVTIQRSNDPQDQFGQELPEWYDVVTVWAFVEPLSGKETFLAEQLKGDTYYTVTMRGLGSSYSVVPTDRLLWQDPDNPTCVRTLNVEGVANVGGYGASLVLTCTERVAGS